MSWLLVALIPGLLMLATLGLERVESGLRRDTITPADVDTFAQSGVDRALHSIHRRVDVSDATARDFIQQISAPGLPTHEYLQHLANTEFRQTRHANRV
ncbi:hypothetical protein PDG61_02580 [Mycolicibacterium sp. BiH015]|uniref:hypothetical protein n=1 Tax=Mycolicibacterium sp. BiH015 TaxID=3018808 RepID=UPI0022DFC1E6|nr:hypothetical protein [Mycolicibacterium sp. BiH015]MDA2889790.1 hypothetical protein [Mycolicibacterium sp. BiH015]